jgi:hypothetical protein
MLVSVGIPGLTTALPDKTEEAYSVIGSLVVAAAPQV